MSTRTPQIGDWWKVSPNGTPFAIAGFSDERGARVALHHGGYTDVSLLAREGIFLGSERRGLSARAFIDRALLDRYFRATGWTRREAPPGWDRYDIGIADSSDVATVVDRAQRVLGPDVDVRFRLGICASVQELETLRMDGAVQLLELVGILPENWEQAKMQASS